MSELDVAMVSMIIPIVLLAVAFINLSCKHDYLKDEVAELRRRVSELEGRQSK